jgi:hypothetical protein
MANVTGHTIGDVNINVHAWADAFGVWHVRAGFISDVGVGNAWLAEYGDAVRTLCRRRMRNEIVQRGAVGNLWRCRVEVVDSRETHLGTITSITYAERRAS